ncbi:hypothetical protein J1605_015310 [Eschrichtius robustus]|uniref:Uncharacterized protein n=1 Tax=Eschrichtius robustus TaxID=9764 RepID=A0AB34GD05_ESCRO|nr:hypothetical protein J1605_015310 [Eschrichtius robustus]
MRPEVRNTFLPPVPVVSVRGGLPCSSPPVPSCAPCEASGAPCPHLIQAVAWGPGWGWPLPLHSPSVLAPLSGQCLCHPCPVCSEVQVAPHPQQPLAFGPTELRCNPGQFACRSGAIQCIPLPWQCDGLVTCEDESDEADCPGPSAADCRARAMGGMRGPKRPRLGALRPTASPWVAALVTSRGPPAILLSRAPETGVDATRSLSCGSFARFCSRPLDEGCPQEQRVHSSPGSQLGGCASLFWRNWRIMDEVEAVSTSWRVPTLNSPEPYQHLAHECPQSLWQAGPPSS